MNNSTPEFQKKMVPLALHGDGTPVIGIGKIWSRQLTICSFNSLLGHGATKDMQLHVWSCFDECCGPSTKDEFCTILSWSLEALQKGRWPESNHLGQKYDPGSAEGKLAGTFLAKTWNISTRFFNCLITRTEQTHVPYVVVLEEMMTLPGRIAD